MNKKIQLFCFFLLFFSVSVILYTEDSSPEDVFYNHYWILRRAIDEAQSNNRDLAADYAAKADSLYKQQKNYSDGAFNYRTALAMYPNAAWYFDLGNCLYFLGMYEESMQAYSAAAFLNYRDVHYAYYNAACTASLVKDRDNGYFYLDNAFASGFGPTSLAWDDSDLTHLREWKDFNHIISEAGNLRTQPDSLLHGQWIDQPTVAAAMPENYNFSSDGTYYFSSGESYSYDQKPGSGWGGGYSGAYRIENDFLILSLNEAPDITIRVPISDIYYTTAFNMNVMLIDQVPYWRNGPGKQGQDIPVTSDIHP